MASLLGPDVTHSDALASALGEPGLDVRRMPALDSEDSYLPESGPSESATTLYLRDITSVALLRLEEEIELAQDIDSGCDAERRLRNEPDLAEPHRAHLSDLAVRGERRSIG